MPAKKTIFEKGTAFGSVQELVTWLSIGGWVYWMSDGKPKHPRVIENMSLATLRGAIARGRLFEAVRRKEG